MTSIFIAISIFFTILFFIHWIFYCFLLSVFQVKKRKIKIIISLILIFLSLGFLISLSLGYLLGSRVSDILYIISGLWYGFLINSLMFIPVYAVVVLLARFYKKIISNLFFGELIILITLIYSGWGVYNALFPEIKNITVEIENLPIEWENKTIIQLSDVHLGRELGVDFINRVIGKVNEIKPEAVMITGDLFDGMDGHFSEFFEPLNNIQAEKGTYYVTGNHEIYLGVEEIITRLKQTRVNVLDDRVVDVDGLQIIGVDYPNFSEKKDIKKIIESDPNFVLNKPSILLYHSPTNIFSDSNGEMSGHSMYLSPDMDFAPARELGIDLQLSGHTHKGQLFPFNFLTSFIYGGYDYGLHSKDGFNIYISSGVGVWGPMMRTSARSEIVAITLKNK